MEKIFLLNSLTVLRIYIFRKYGPNTLNGQQPIQVPLSRQWGDRSFQSSASCILFISTYQLIYSLRFSRFPSSLPLRTPTCCSFHRHPSPFLLSSQPPVFHPPPYPISIAKPLSQINIITTFSIICCHLSVVVYTLTSTASWSHACTLLYIQESSTLGYK